MTKTGNLQRLQIMKELCDLSSQQAGGWKYVTLRGREPVQSAECAARLGRMALSRRLLETSDASLVREEDQRESSTRSPDTNLQSSCGPALPMDGGGDWPLTVTTSPGQSAQRKKSNGIDLDWILGYL
jgi:hypothetical protein